jgi:Ca2+-binding EF-hand superfamily protein
MRGIGLLGTWSPNCTVPPGTLGAARVTYDAPDSGPATFSSTSTIPIDTRPEIISIFEIEEATILANNQIKLVGKYAKISRTDGQVTSPVDGALYRITIEKNNSLIRTIDVRLTDDTKISIEAGVVRATGKQTPTLNKCDASPDRPIVAQPAVKVARAPAPQRPAAQTNYLLSKLSPNMKLADYLKLMNGEFRWADADADGELSNADGELLDQMAAAGFRTMYFVDFWRADLDADGAVTMAELRQVQTYRFHSTRAQPAAGKTIQQTVEDQIREIMAADADHDGRVTFAEAMDYARALPYPPTGELQVRNLMSAVPDGRSVLSLADFDAAVEKMFRALDADGDGVVSAAELNAYCQAHAGDAAQ